MQLPATTPKGLTYRQQMSAINALSYSTLLTAHSCPRRMLLEKVVAHEQSEEVCDNPDFLFGHAVGAGIQSYLIHGDREVALLDCFLAWNGSLDTEKEKSKKSIWYALQAVEKFITIRDAIFPGWIVPVLKGKPAVELAFKLDLENGYYYLGHIDVILFHPENNVYMVLELKTSSFTSIDEAVYKNSSQALGYSIILDKLVGKEATTSYTVFYLVYKTGGQEFVELPFLKTRTQRASFIKETLMDCVVMEFYKEQNYYPMRGESCYSFFRQCEFFGVCQLKSLQDRVGELGIIEEGEAVQGVDVEIKLSELD